jgi:ADP-heptose:LPS heptosyltransferase
MNSSKPFIRNTPKKASLFLLRQLDNNEILFIHLGGLGDVCLSESIFYSLQKHFGACLVGLGNKRFLNLFKEYFLRVEGIESRKWLYLFSEKLDGPRWKQIIYVGKDRESTLRNRWQRFSKGEIIFIDMYPENAFNIQPTVSRKEPQINEKKVHIEDYQSVQLTQYGIAPLKKVPLRKKSSRVVLYPEKGFEKEKWNYENFLSLYRSLETQDLEVVVLESLGLSLDVDDKLFFEDLMDIKGFFAEGGIFVSNDSGMAHLAGASGLYTITIFTDFDPTTWHPRGRNISLVYERDFPDLSFLEKTIVQITDDS